MRRCAALRAVLGQQHQSRPAAAADRATTRPPACGAGARTASRVSFVIPSGNLGNAIACVWARQMGLPIGASCWRTTPIAPCPIFCATGSCTPRASIPTLCLRDGRRRPEQHGAPAALYPDARRRFGPRRCASSVDDDAIRARIRTDFAPLRPDLVSAHRGSRRGACAAGGFPNVPASRWMLVATAHPAKFREIVEPADWRKRANAGKSGETVRSPVECDRDRTGHRGIEARTVNHGTD